MSNVATELDMRSRKSMIDYLESHEMYKGDFTHNIKAYNFLPSGVRDNISENEFEEVVDYFDCLLEEFNKTHPIVRIGIEGRSGGHMVLRDVDYSVYKHRPIDIEDLRYFCRCVKTFDEFYADTRKEVTDFARALIADRTTSGGVENG